MPLTSPRFRNEPTLEACHGGTHRMLSGERGEAVAIVQQALIDSGLPLADGADGIFGPDTAAKVSKFKRDRGIFPDDGVVGVKTMSALDAAFPIVDLFQPFVAAGRLDAGAAALLNELHVFPAHFWARETAHFAFVELSNLNLAGIVRGATATSLKPFLPASEHARLDQLQAAGNIANNGETFTVNDGGHTRGFSLLRDDIAGGVNRRFSFLVIAHELTHFRNRVVAQTLNADTTFPPTAYVDPALAQSHNANPGHQPSNVTRASLTGEWACRHVAWRVGKDVDHLPQTLAAGQLFLAARGFAFAAADPLQDYNDSGYMAVLKGLGTEFDRQVAIWMTDPLASQFLFHFDAVTNNVAQTAFRNDAAFAQSLGFSLPAGTVADGLA